MQLVLIFLSLALLFYFVVNFSKLAIKFLFIIVGIPFAIHKAYITGSPKDRHLWKIALWLWMVVALLVGLALFLSYK